MILSQVNVIPRKNLEKSLLKPSLELLEYDRKYYLFNYSIF